MVRFYLREEGWGEEGVRRRLEGMMSGEREGGLREEGEGEGIPVQQSLGRIQTQSGHCKPHSPPCHGSYLHVYLEFFHKRFKLSEVNSYEDSKIIQLYSDGFIQMDSDGFRWVHLQKG